MQDTGHIDPKTTQAVRAILDRPQEPDTSAEDAEFIIDFYKKNYEFVQVVRCLNCGNDLCLWVLDRPRVRSNMHMHPLGLQRIELGDHLRSTRKRHDGAVGYYCSCGADSRISEIEKGYVTQSSVHIPADAPHIEALVKKKILATNFKPKVEEVDGKFVVEGFEHEVIKGQNNA